MRSLQFAKNGVKYCEIYLTGTHNTLTHKRTTHSHTHIHTQRHATLVALYEFIMKTDRTCHSIGCADSRLRFIYLIFLFFILVFTFFRLIVVVVVVARFSMTLTLSWEICLYIRNVAQKFYCINLLLLYLWHAQWADWQKLLAIKKIWVKRVARHADTQQVSLVYLFIK